MMNPSSSELVATVCFALALLHTFLVKKLQGLARHYPEGSAAENLFHLLGEVEIVFGFWAGVYLIWLALSNGREEAIAYLQGRSFTEAAFVFVILTICSTQPILLLASRMIEAFSQLIPLRKPLAFYCAALTAGPLLGSLITEPAAMTVTALILLDKYYRKGMSQPLMYATLGLLFVNVSIGGVMTPFAAPPVLMVAPGWGWDLKHMLLNFGWKGALASILSTALVAFRFREELRGIRWDDETVSVAKFPMWVSAAHLFFLILVVMSSHHLVVFVGLFMFFLGLVTVTREYQQELKIREGLLVAFFLGGLVVLGGPQRWWLEPLLTRLSSLPLYLGAMGLTAITDNAALTYLGAQVPGLTDLSQYALVAGSVVGGGLTVIANAPNPAGYGILNSAFGDDGISPLGLFRSAAIPTLVAALCFWFL